MYCFGQRLRPIQLLLLMMMALLGQRLRPIHQLHPLVLAPPGQQLRPIQPQLLVLALAGQRLRPIQPPAGTGAPGAAAVANPAPAAGTGAGVTAANATAPLINQGIRGGGPLGMQQARYAAGNAIVTPNGVCGKNPDQTSILAQMNQEVALGIQHL
jgi:hypothetical protein